MLHQLKQGWEHTLVTGLVVALASTFMACAFTPPGDLETPEDVNKILDMAPVRSLEEANRWTVYEDPGKIRVQHGFGYTQVSKAATADYIGFRIQDREEVPRDIGDTGTIILNGWDITYPNGDHHVLGLGSVIYNMTHIYTADRYALEWEAGGVLSDKDGNDGYRWCYRYTLVFWRQGAIDAVAFQEDESTTFVDSGYVNDTALKEIPGKFTALNDKAGPRAVLPRGFGLSWAHDDHHVLQVGFDLGTPPVAGTPVITGNEITWTSQTVLKDNATLHGYNGAELVTILGGQSVEMWQPRQVLHLTGNPPDWVPESTDLNLRPAGSGNAACVFGEAAEEFVEFYSVENVPYDYAIPVLTGWDMQYECTDHHVERLGVYLVEFEYVKDPNAATGTLNYTIFSTLRDDSDNGHHAKYKVSILGLDALGGSTDK